MDEGNVGKDFASNEQQKSEKLTLEAIKNLKIRPGQTINIGGMEITNYGGQSTIKIQGSDAIFGILDKDGKFTFNREKFEEAKKNLEEKGLDLEKLGLPDIEQWIDQQEQERDKFGRDERGLSKDMKEKGKPEREEPEKQDGDEKKQKINLSSAVEVNYYREVNEDKTFAGLMKKEFDEAKQAERFFLVQNPNDANDYNLYATDNQGNVIDEIPLEHTEGKNPMNEDIAVLGKDGKNIETQQAVQILKIGNSPSSAMLVITKGTRTGTEVHIGNRSMGDDYQAHKISSSTRQRDNMDANESVKKETSHTLAERNQGSAEKKYYEVLKRLEKQGVPDEANPAKDGISVGEIEVNSMGDLSASLAAIFAKEYGLSKECAMNTAKGVVEGGKDFDKALEQGFKIEEKAGRIAPGSAEKRAEQAKEYSKSGQKEEEEVEKLPGQGQRKRN